MKQGSTLWENAFKLWKQEVSTPDRYIAAVVWSILIYKGSENEMYLSSNMRLIFKILWLYKYINSFTLIFG